MMRSGSTCEDNGPMPDEDGELPVSAMDDPEPTPTPDGIVNQKPVAASPSTMRAVRQAAAWDKNHGEATRKLLRDIKPVLPAMKFLAGEQSKLSKALNAAIDTTAISGALDAISNQTNSDLARAMAPISASLIPPGMTSLTGKQIGIQFLDPAVQEAIRSAVRPGVSGVFGTPMTAPAFDAIRRYQEQQFAGINKLIARSAVPLGLLEAPFGAVEEMRRRFTEARPPNWSERVELKYFENAEEIIRNEGIPLAWVPREEILVILLRAESRGDRIDVLLDRAEHIAEDCTNALSNLDGDLQGLASLALSAVETYRAGFEPAAMALAVNVVESAVNHVMPVKSHNASKLVDFPLMHAPFLYLRGFVSLLPLTAFYESWKPGYGTRPQNLSRHVVAHGLTGVDERPEEPLVALMYAASILRGLQDWVDLDLAGVAAQARRDAKDTGRVANGQ